MFWRKFSMNVLTFMRKNEVGKNFKKRFPPLLFGTKYFADLLTDEWNEWINDINV